MGVYFFMRGKYGRLYINKGDNIYEFNFVLGI